MAMGAAAFVFSQEEYTWALGVALKGMILSFEKEAADNKKKGRERRQIEKKEAEYREEEQREKIRKNIEKTADLFFHFQIRLED